MRGLCFRRTNNRPDPAGAGADRPGAARRELEAAGFQDRPPGEDRTVEDILARTRELESGAGASDLGFPELPPAGAGQFGPGSRTVYQTFHFQATFHITGDAPYEDVERRIEEIMRRAANEARLAESDEEGQF